ncbi:hypothetical protein [Serratia fonticola]|uniref:hypothetical protein n=1 Tax=Serratia fonticola TaxID=47917 RepID=UPI0024DE8E59|nr:hypothetical protein [Serratia fonticola]MDK2375047.1 hypothetical protein [Serratia fonticola]
MRSPVETNAADAVGQSGGIVRTIVYSVLISAGVLLLKIGWGKPQIAITLALLLAHVSGMALMRLLAGEQQKTLAALWRSLLLAAVGLLLVLLGSHDGLMVLPGMIIVGIGLGCASWVTTALLQPSANIGVVSAIASLVVIGVALSVTLLIESQASVNFAVAWLIDLLLLGALVARIAERDVA